MLLAAMMAIPLFVGAGEHEADELTRVAVFHFETVGDVPMEAVKALSEKLLVYVSRVGGYSEIGQADIEAMIGVEIFKQRTGCDDSGCLAELAGAADIDLLLSGTIVIDKVANTYSVIAKLVDTRRASVRGRTELSVTRTTAALLGSAEQIGEALFGMGAMRLASVRATRRGHYLWALTAAVVAVVAVAVGGFLIATGLDAKAEADQAYTAYATAGNGATATAIHDDVVRLIDEHNARITIGYPMLGVGAVAVAAATYALLRMPAIGATVRVSDGGAALVLQGRF